MKTMRLSLLMLFLISIFFPLSTFAEDYTQWGLPEGATMRLGKGGLQGNIVFSPDSTLLAVSTAIGILPQANTKPLSPDIQPRLRV